MMEPVCWGWVQFSVKQLHARFPTGSSSSWKNFDEYTFHVAGGQGYYVAHNYRTVSQGVHLYPPLPVVPPPSPAGDIRPRTRCNACAACSTHVSFSSTV